MQSKKLKNIQNMTYLNEKISCKPFRRSIVEIFTDFNKEVPERFIRKKPIFSKQVWFVVIALGEKFS